MVSFILAPLLSTHFNDNGMPSSLLHLNPLLHCTASARASSPIALSTLASSSGFVGSRFIRRKNLINHHQQLFSTTKIMSTTSSYKRAKLSHLAPSTKTIGTHSGTFQADEALGVWLLRQLPAYRHSPVTRSRDSAVLDTCDIVIDVGGVYDHANLRYDHHQREYNEKFYPKLQPDGTVKERCTKMSASGLVYKHYGKEVITEYYPELKNEDSNLEWVFTKMYGSFMEAIDAIDTGVEPIPDNNDELELQYFDSTGLSSRVGRTNPRWNEVDEATGKSPDPDERFEIASSMCGVDFLSVLTKIVESDLPARSIVEGAVQKRFECDESGEIICLPAGGLPWKSQLYELEHDLKVTTPIKFVLYTDQAGIGEFNVLVLKGKLLRTVYHCQLNGEEWRDEDLSSVAGIEGCTFCHSAGFIGGNKSYEGVLEMARVALSLVG